jgi:hypothetical protein
VSDLLKPGDRAICDGLRRAHIAIGDGGRVLCKEVILWGLLGSPGEKSRSWIAGDEVPTCVTCSKRAKAAARKAGGGS